MTQDEQYINNAQVDATVQLHLRCNSFASGTGGNLWSGLPYMHCMPYESSSANASKCRVRFEVADMLRPVGGKSRTVWSSY